jgi:predicted amidohydrolase YtcJ
MLVATALLCSFALPWQDPPPAAPPHVGTVGSLLVSGVSVWTGTAEEWPFAGHLAAVAGSFQAGQRFAPMREDQHLRLANAFAVPGLIDAHGHLLNLGTALAEVDLVGTGSYAEVIAKVAQKASTMPKGSWVTGRGWDQNDWGAGTELPHHRELSAAIPDHPVWLTRIDGHAALVNAAAMKVAGVSATCVVGAGGELRRDDSGEPTGVLVDDAMNLVKLPALTAQQIRERLLTAQQVCLEHGLTCVHDAGVDRATLDTMVALHKEGRWLLRTYVMLAPNERELIARGPWQTPDGKIIVRAVKAYADGALGSYGAALMEPYADRRGFKGLPTMPRPGIQALAQFCAESGMQLCMHAIGDAAVHAVLDAYAAVAAIGPPAAAALRFRIEHAQIVADADFERCQRLGVLPSMQPTHLTSDMPWATARLGPERVVRAYAWKRFLELGVPVPFGSDFPVESVDPRKGLFAAVTTRGERSGPAGGYRPDQRLSREQALRGFTRHAAQAMFLEAKLGTIEVGKLAGYTVFDRDLRTCPEDEIREAKVLLTVIGGLVVYDGRAK